MLLELKKGNGLKSAASSVELRHQGWHCHPMVELQWGYQKRNARLHKHGVEIRLLCHYAHQSDVEISVHNFYESAKRGQEPAAFLTEFKRWRNEKFFVLKLKTKNKIMVSELDYFSGKWCGKARNREEDCEFGGPSTTGYDCCWSRENNALVGKAAMQTRIY